MKIIEAARPLLDSALTHHFCRLQKKGFLVQRWLELHQDLAAFVLDSADMKAVMAANREYASVGPQVNRLSVNTFLGQHAFGCANLRNDLDGLLKQCLDADFSETSIAEASQRCDARAKLFETRSSATKRNIDLDMAGIRFQLTVTSVTQEFEVRLQTLLKSFTLGRVNGLPIMPHERIMLSTGVNDEGSPTRSGL